MADKEPEKTPNELIAEYHHLSRTQPGNLTYKDGKFTLTYPTTKMTPDVLSRSGFETVLEIERKIYDRFRATQDKFLGVHPMEGKSEMNSGDSRLTNSRKVV